MIKKLKSVTPIEWAIVFTIVVILIEAAHSVSEFFGMCAH